jgi:hypothetical protein
MKIILFRRDALTSVMVMEMVLVVFICAGREHFYQEVVGRNVAAKMQRLLQQLYLLLQLSLSHHRHQRNVHMVMGLYQRIRIDAWLVVQLPVLVQLDVVFSVQQMDLLVQQDVSKNVRQMDLLDHSFVGSHVVMSKLAQMELHQPQMTRRGVSIHAHPMDH